MQHAAVRRGTEYVQYNTWTVFFFHLFFFFLHVCINSNIAHHQVHTYLIWWCHCNSVHHYFSSVIRLSLGKLLVNLLQVVKRTNTPLISLTNGVVDRPWVCGSWVRSPHRMIHHNKLFQIFPWRTWKILSPVYPGNETAWVYWQVRPYIRPTCYPAVSGGESVIRLSLGKLLVNLLQVVKRTITPLIDSRLLRGIVQQQYTYILCVL